MLPTGGLEVSLRPSGVVPLVFLCGLLGIQLTAILTSPTPAHGPGVGLAFIGAVFARQAVADVRLVASGYRNISLAREDRDDRRGPGNPYRISPWRRSCSR